MAEMLETVSTITGASSKCSANTENSAKKKKNAFVCVSIHYYCVNILRWFIVIGCRCCYTAAEEVGAGLDGSLHTCFLYANSRSSITSSSVYKYVVLFLSAAAILLVSVCGNILVNWYLDAFIYLISSDLLSRQELFYFHQASKLLCSISRFFLKKIIFSVLASSCFHLHFGLKTA